MLANTVKETIPQLIDRIVQAAQVRFSDQYNGLPGLILGTMGVGKSSAFYQAAERLTEQTGKLWQVVDIRALLYDPVELKGLQAYDGESSFTRLLSPDWARELDPDGHYLIVFEEVTKALPSVQSALMQIILDRRVASFTFGRNWVPFATGNLATDRSGDIPMPAALRDRFWIVEADHDAGKWIDYAMARNLRPEITSFIRMNPDMLSTWSNKDPLVFATARSYEALSNAMEKGGADLWAIPLLGKEAGTRFQSHCQVIERLPDPADVFRNPESAEVMDDIGAAFYLAESLAYFVGRDTMGALCTYAERCASEVGMAMIESAVARHPECKETREYIAYKCKYDPHQQ